MNEARCERCRHTVGDAAIAFAVAAGDQRRAFGQLVLAAFAVEHQLIKSGLDHGQGEGSSSRLMSQRPGSSDGGRKEGDAQRVRSAPSRQGMPRRSTGIEQQCADVDVFAAGGGRDLLSDVRFGAAGRSPDHSRLARFHQQSHRIGKLVRSQRVVGGDGIGVGHWELRTSGSRGRNASRRPDPRPLPSLAFLLAVSGHEPTERIERPPPATEFLQLRRRCCVREGTGGSAAAWYCFSAGRKAAHPQIYLARFGGWMLSAGYAGFGAFVHATGSRGRLPSASTAQVLRYPCCLELGDCRGSTEMHHRPLRL